MPPMPAPFGHMSSTICCKANVNKTSNIPPKITLLTELLFDGNNVLTLKIIDKLPLIERSLIYSAGNHSITTYLAKEHNNEYKSLIKVFSPKTALLT